jgi:hypothetical protein
MKWHVVKGCYGQHYPRVTYMYRSVMRSLDEPWRSLPIRFGMKMKMFSWGWTSASVTWLCAEPFPFMDVRTGPVFGVGVDGAEAAEVCRRVFILDISCGHSSSFFRVSYLPQL